ncbi:hypothetical protein PROFUN_00733 [Planoprotostelium fungivorum]|uniref:Uncharacterized protein n=1 Tax=Planoprotostelium fungivorum TaxID=1890364 RepID=A0A2P6NU82_9EUKA|nr:hypothetical protein PROFUN_00733 [Planoprotostelium fungivorum]
MIRFCSLKPRENADALHTLKPPNYSTAPYLSSDLLLETFDTHLCRVHSPWATIQGIHKANTHQSDACVYRRYCVFTFSDRRRIRSRHYLPVATSNILKMTIKFKYNGKEEDFRVGVTTDTLKDAFGLSTISIFEEGSIPDSRVPGALNISQVVDGSVYILEGSAAVQTAPPGSSSHSSGLEGLIWLW